MPGSAFNPSSWGRKAIAGVAVTAAAGAGMFWWQPWTTSPSGGCSITAPVAGATVSGASVSVKASCVGSGTVTFFADGGQIGSPQATAPYAVTWDTTGEIDGAHQTCVAQGSVQRCVTVTTSNSVAAQVAVSPTGNDSTCVRGNLSLPCLTFGKAYQIASPGDYVQVAAGTYLQSNNTSGYERELIPYDASKVTASMVTFQPSPGATVTLGAQTTLNSGSDQAYANGNVYSIPVVSTNGFYTSGSYRIRVGVTQFICTGSDSTDFTGCTATSTITYKTGAIVSEGGLDVQGGHYVTFSGMTVKGNMSAEPATATENVSHVTFSNISCTCDAAATTTGAISGTGTTDSVVYSGGSYGGTNYGKAAITLNNTSNTAVSGITFANVNRNTNTAAHIECVYLSGNTGLTFDADAFANTCQLYGIFNSYGTGLYNQGEKVTNSMFASGGVLSKAIYFRVNGSDTLDGITLQGNSFGSPVQVDNGSASGASLTNWTVAGNIYGTAGACMTSESGFTTWTVTQVYNVMPDASCSSVSAPVANNNTTGVLSSQVWADSTALPLDLISTSTPAEHVVNATYCNVKDYYGTTRPTPCDAGAEEK